MMRVVFFDKLRETYTSVGDVVLLEDSDSRIKGRYTKVWHLILKNGTTRAFKQKDYTIHKVEI